MADWPALLVNPQHPVVGTFNGGNCLFSDAWIATAEPPSGGAVWPAANRAIYVPVQIEETCKATTFAIRVTVQSGNCDVGIYDEKGNRIVSKGSTAVAAAGMQTFDLTASVTGTASPVLTPGTYYLAMCVDNTTAAVYRSGAGALLAEVCGVQQQALGAVTLGSTATFANPASAYVPGMAVTTASVI